MIFSSWRARRSRKLTHEPNGRRRSSIVLLSTADLDAAVLTNKQHIAMRLSERMDVVYIDSLGLRYPRLNRSDLARIGRRLSPGSQSKRVAPRVLAEERAGRLRRVRPLVLPWHRCGWVRAFNRFAFDWQVRRLVAELSPDTIWSFSPLTYGVERHFKQVVYHSVDLLHHLEDMPSALLLRSERELVAHCSLAIGSSPGIVKHLEEQGATEPLFWPNVADVSLFSKDVLTSQRRRKVIFAGHLTVAKVDLNALRACMDEGLPLTLVGPIAIDGSLRGPIDELLAHPLASYCGVLSQEALAVLFRDHQVGLIPYTSNRYLDGVLPMKLYEYLAAGLAVVSTPLPSVQQSECADIVIADGPGYAAAVAAASDKTSPGVIRRRIALAAANSWEHRIEQVLGVVDER